MNIMQILRENPRARAVILSMNEADIMRKFGLTLSNAKKVRNYAGLLQCLDSNPELRNQIEE